jgi:hypothetical protein
VNDKTEIRRHPFFKDLNWTQLMNKEIDPPLVMTMEEEENNEELQFLKS